MPLVKEWLFLFVQKTYSHLVLNPCHDDLMEGEKQTCLEQPEVTFSIEIRASTPAQVEAGKRLFKKLMTRAQSSLQTSNESKQAEKKT